MNSRYRDIIFLPHPRSHLHSPMPRESRAAQFAPFAALNGYEDAVEETARLTSPAPEKDEDSLFLMDEKLHALLDVIRDLPQLTITYFEPDGRKEGGSYLRITGRIRRVDEVNRLIILTDRTEISLDSICELEADE